MGTKSSIFYPSLPDPLLGNYPSECFQKKATHVVVFIKSPTVLKNAHFLKKTIYIGETGLVFFNNLIFGSIAYDLYYSNSPKTIEGIEYKMEVCIQIIADENVNYIYDICQKIMDEEAFIEKINMAGDHWERMGKVLIKKA